MWKRNLRSKTIKQKLIVIFIALLCISSIRANTLDEFSYENIFGSDSGGGESLSTDNLLAPFIVLGITSGEIFVNIRPDLSIASIEKEPFLKTLKTYLKPSIFKSLSNIDTEYLPLVDFPEGLTVIMDENLSISVDLIPEVMSDISPEIYMEQPKIRDTIRNKTNSLINDIALNYEKKLFSFGIDNRIRMGDYYAYARNNFGQDIKLLQDYYLGYEAQEYDILAGTIKPRTFGGIYPESLLGAAFTNSLLSGNVVLESNPRYINIAHESTVKVYIDDILEETKDYKPGRQRLNIPLQNTKSNIKVEIKDKYGREEVIDFNFAGRYASKIPSEDQMLYFVGAGQNEISSSTQLYAGVELGIDTLTKAQFSTLLGSDIQILGGQYYLATDFGNNETYLNLSNGKSFGYSLRNYTHLYLGDVFIDAGVEYTKDYEQSSLIPAINATIINAGASYRHSKHLVIKGGIEQNFTSNILEYNLRAAYALNNNATFRASYYDTEEEKTFQLGVEYKFAKDGTTSGQYTNNLLSTNTRYVLDNNEFVLNTFDTDQDFKVTNTHDIFKSRVVLTNADDEVSYSARTQFSVVATNEGMDLVERLGKSSFVMFKTDADFIENMLVEYADKNCYLEKDTTCTMKILSGRENYFAYNLDNMPLNVQVSPATEEPFFAAGGSGKARWIVTREAFFVQGTLLNKGKKVSLLIAEVIDSEGNKEEIFTDEEGSFFAELLEGEYTISLGDAVSKTFSIDKSEAKEGIVDIGQLNLP